MKNGFFKAFVAMLYCTMISFCTCIGTAIAVAVLYKPEEPASSASVSTFTELYNAANSGIKNIKILDDILITGTIYFPGVTTIEIDSACTLTRAENFLGDLFVIGENSEGKNNILTTGVAASLTLKTNNASTLTIDGNSENITEVVTGTAFLISNTAKLNMQENVIIRDCKKLGSNLTEEDRVSYPTEVGGAAVIITSGSFNMYGGHITNCETNLDEDSSEIACHGGAIYNYGTFNMYGGKISECKAARGGALYNYKISNIVAGEISSNSSTVYGGAIYNPNSQYSNLNIGQNSADTKVYITNNETEGSGGAIFSSIMASIYANGATLFEENIASDNGGAINSPGANVIKNITFSKNQAGSKGGAIYVYHNKPNTTVRHTIIDSVTFTQNVAASGGGALGIGSSADDGSYSGAIAYITDCTFSTNNAKQGGAVYIIRLSTVELNACNITENIASDNGGGVYVTGASALTIKNCDIENNSAVGNGGGIYSTTDAKSKIIGTQINNNSAKGGGGIFATANSSFAMENCFVNNNEATSGNGGGLYIYTTVVASIKNTQVNNNETSKYGGAPYVSGKANVLLEDITANGNAAGEGGFLYLTSSGTIVKIVSGEAKDNTAGVDKGSTIWTNSSSVVLQIQGTTTKSHFDYNGEILGKGAVGEYDA